MFFRIPIVQAQKRRDFMPRVMWLIIFIAKPLRLLGKVVLLRLRRSVILPTVSN
jgi:hypothetical protein